MVILAVALLVSGLVLAAGTARAYLKTPADEHAARRVLVAAAVAAVVLSIAGIAIFTASY